MTSILAKTGIAALIALGALSGTVSTAAAQGAEFGIYIQGGPDRDYRDRDYRDRDYRELRRDYREYRRERREARRDRCAPWFAEEKASRMGLRRARVVDVSRRTVTVVGFDRHGRDRVIFANDRGCPVIRR